MLNSVNGVTKAVSKHPFATSGSIALLSAAAGLAYVMWDKNRRVTGNDNGGQEFTDNYDSNPVALDDIGEAQSGAKLEGNRSKLASLWLGAGFAFSAVLSAALYYRYTAKSNALMARLPSPTDLASTSMSHIHEHLNTVKNSANSVYSNVAKKAGNIR